MSADPLLAYRPEFPILERTRYLVSHSLGAMPRGARTGMDAYAEAWDARGVRAWSEEWWELPVVVGDAVARIIGAPPGSICMQPNVTLATAIFLSACPAEGARNRIVTDALHFPSLLYLFDESARAAGLQVVTVPSDDDVRVDPERLLNAIDEQTRVVAISHVQFRSSQVQDVASIAARARDAGAHVLLDVFQSAGIVPLDVTALGIDAAVGGCLKWLCGGPGTGFLYVRPELADRLEPALTGWQSHEDPFAFAPPPHRRAKGAWRFLHGTPAVPSLKAAEAGLRIVLDADVTAIRAKSLRQTALILDRAAREGWAVRTPERDVQRGGVVVIDPEHAYEVSRELLRREVIVDFRPGSGIRLGPHFYNSDEEITSALDAIAEILGSGSWRLHTDQDRERVT